MPFPRKRWKSISPAGTGRARVVRARSSCVSWPRRRALAPSSWAARAACTWRTPRITALPGWCHGCTRSWVPRLGGDGNGGGSSRIDAQGQDEGRADQRHRLLRRRRRHRHGRLVHFRGRSCTRSTTWRSSATTTRSYANTDIQISGASPWGANTTFTPPGKKFRIMHDCWKKNIAAMYAVGHVRCNYVATADASYPADLIDKVRKALAVKGPRSYTRWTPAKGWDYDPFYSHKLGEFGRGNRPFPAVADNGRGTHLYGHFRTPGVWQTFPQARARVSRDAGPLPPFLDEDYEFFQGVDKMWNDWMVPGVIPFKVNDPSKK